MVGSMSISAKILGLTSSATMESHPHLHEALAELCQKAGMEKPHLHLVEEKALKAAAIRGEKLVAAVAGIPAAALLHKGEPYIIVNDIYAKAFGMESLNGPITDELKAIFAHELGHIKRQDLEKFGTSKLSFYSALGCVGAALGVTKYLHYRHEHALQKEAEISPHPDELKELNSPTISTASAATHYILAGLAGLVMGGFVFRHMRHRMEYACDAFSKELMVSGKPLISAFEKLEAFIDSKLADRVNSGRITAEKAASMKKIQQAIGQMLHPPHAQRVAALG